MKKDTYYFSHDSNARKDEKILCLLAEHGYEGYGIYWVLVEMMFEAPDTAITRKLIKGIAYDIRVDITLLQKIITTCYNAGLFQADKEKIWSNSLRRRKAEWEEKKKKRSAAGKLGMANRWHSDNNVINPDNNVITEQLHSYNGAITKHNKGKERKGKEKKVFIAPTVEEVRAYFVSNGYTEEAANKAYEYYNTAEWYDSEGKKVHSWKQKMIANWFKDDYRTKAPIKNLPKPEQLPSRLKKITA